VPQRVVVTTANRNESFFAFTFNKILRDVLCLHSEVVDARGVSMQQEQQGILQKRTRDFQDILKRERIQRGWSQADVAEKIGSDPKTVGRWERGITFPSPYMCQQLSKLYEKSIQELRLIREETPPSLPTMPVLQTSEPVYNSPSTPKETLFIPSPKFLRNRHVFLYLSLLLIVLLLIVFILRWPLYHTTSALTVKATPSSNNPYTNSGTLALHENLTADSATGWSLTQNGQGQCFFADGSYRIRDIQTGAMEVCLANETYFTNFTYEVTMTIEIGDCGGLAFRSTFPQLYYFLSCFDGRYRLVRYDKDNPSNRRIIASGTSPIIHQGFKTSNILAVVANGGTFKVYINHAYILTGTDAAYFDGQIGLIAHTCRYTNTQPNLCDAPTEVSFNNARVWKMA
jgi:transcriptional regulator with XRE-family HTH domain